jgi:hypothetical protein
LISLIILSTPEGIALLLVYVKKDFRLLVLFYYPEDSKGLG